VEKHSKTGVIINEQDLDTNTKRNYLPFKVNGLLCEYDEKRTGILNESNTNYDTCGQNHHSHVPCMSFPLLFSFYLMLHKNRFYFFSATSGTQTSQRSAQEKL